MLHGKNMKKQIGLVKFLLTIFLLIGTLNLWTYYDPITAWKLIGSWNTIEMLNKLFGLFYAIAVIVILIRIWKNNKCKSEEKTLWTVLIILLPIIFGNYYLWIKEDKILERPN
jgi:hypothetical protein